MISRSILSLTALSFSLLGVISFCFGSVDKATEAGITALILITVSLIHKITE